ncbi:MAG: PRTRC system ThiF family protein [Anaerolineae bacterium]
MIAFDHPQEIRDIYLVGAGGTGGHLARTVARLVYDMRQKRLSAPHIHFVDPDTVEMKNVGRQMFIPADVGQYKAEVLATRLNRALGLDIAYHIAAFHPDMVQHSHASLIIGAVDNHLARKAIAQIKGALWIDSGNERHNGQVVIGNCGDPQDVIQQYDYADYYGEDETTKLPHVGVIFPDILEPPPAPVLAAPEASCADLVQMDEQSLFVNEWMAMVTTQYVDHVLRRQPIKSLMTFVDVQAMVVKPVPLTRSNLLFYCGLHQYT